MENNNYKIEKYDSITALLKSAKIILIAVPIVCILATVGAIAYMNLEFQKNINSIWVIDSKGAFALHSSRIDKADQPGRIYEYRNTVRLFYENMFSYDQHNFKEQLDRGMKLAGACGKEIADKQITDGMYINLKTTNAIVKCYIDSVKIDRYNKGYVWGVQKFSFPDGTINARRLDAKFDIMELPSRSNENPHGCQIENFIITNTNIIE